MFKIDRRLIRNFDWVTFAIVVLISLIGVMSIYSGMRQPYKIHESSLYLKQLIWICIGIIGLIAVISFDYIWLSRISIPAIVAGIIMLLIVLVAGKTGMGAQRWISLGPISFQPSEFFKIIFIILVADVLSIFSEPLKLVRVFQLFAVLALVPFLLLAKQPDLGTAAIVLMLFLSLILAKGLEKKSLLILIIVGLVSIPFFSEVFWTGLKDYQKNRLIAFISPEVDPTGIGYHISQSKIAIGSGELVGKGFLQGTQGPFRFLPEKHTDFIFAVFAEEWGFVGSIVLLGLYFALLMRGLDTSRKAKDEFGRLLALGITFMIGIYFFINVGMTLGIMPVVGVPLPFMSYGGTALVSNYIAIGILINIRTRRFSLFY